VRFPDHEPSRDTGGEYVLVETILRPDAALAIGAPIGKAFGYREKYEASAEPALA
jgi:hypothetical protein